MHELIIPVLGTLTVVVFSTLLLIWDRRCRRHVRSLDGFTPRIIVTGTRGKSSTVRLIHATLRASGRRPWGRVTGTITEEISPENRQHVMERTGQTSVIEFLSTIDRARAADADSLVMECMAVKPDLIELSQRTFLRGDICVITNARADHMEDEGLDLTEIARSLAGIAIGSRLVITCDHDPSIVEVIRSVAAGYGAEFIHARGETVDPSVLDMLPDEHPDNVAAVLAIADHLGIDRESAISGMRNTTHEPFAVEPITHRTTFDGSTYTFASLGAINDPESTRSALDGVESTLSSSDWRIGIIASRWDRPLRSMEFAGFADPSEFDRLLLAGPLYRVMRRQLRRGGWDLTNVRSLRWIDLRSSAALMRRIATLVDGHHEITVVGLANVDPPVSIRLVRVLEPFHIRSEYRFDGDLVDDRTDRTKVVSP